VTRDEIISEIRRIAELEGRPPGRSTFERHTGLTRTGWAGRYWARWSDALKDAGFSPNAPPAALEEASLLEAYLPIIETLKRLPTQTELRLRKKIRYNISVRGTFLEEIWLAEKSCAQGCGVRQEQAPMD
jgi:hypothetical protein